MPRYLRTVAHHNAKLALTAALLGIAVSSPVPVQARVQQQNAIPGCDPGWQTCYILTTYYTSSSHTSITGRSTTDCNGEITITSGYATSYASSRYFFCE